MANYRLDDDTHDFEKGRIRALRDERLYIQKKTFTKWVNSFLIKVRIEINDLFIDLADGKCLMKLLEIISGEKLGKPNSGKMRVHKIENVNKCLAFLHTKVRLESIGAEDIVDGNPRLILGLIWTIILRFQIQEIEIEITDEEGVSGEKKSAKEALLLWCQRNTRGYKNVEINNFTSSWRDGMAFNALLHKQRPDALDYASLHPTNHTENLNNAFEIAHQKFGIPKLLDPEDVDVQRPDEKSILTYVASYYHSFSKLNEGQRGAKKINAIVTKIKRIEEQKEQYKLDSKALLKWIAVKTEEMGKRNFSNSLEGVQNDFKKFQVFSFSEKPPKAKEFTLLQVTFFEIEMKLKELKQPPFVPPEGQRISDIEQAWRGLEKEEHMKNTALKMEILRQQKLEQLAAQFHQKIGLRNGYLDEMILVLSDSRYGSNLSNVEASLKKHQAISADILSRENRFKDIEKKMEYFEEENYHAKQRIRKSGDDVLEKWKHLLELLNKHQQKLELDTEMLAHLRDLDTVHASVVSLQNSFDSEEFQKAANIEESMQKLNLYESEIKAIQDSIKRLKSQGKQFSHVKGPISDNIAKNLSLLEEDYKKLSSVAKTTRQKFEDLQCIHQIKNDLDDIGHWLAEKTALSSSAILVKDVQALNVQLEKQKTAQTEFKKWLKKYDNVQQSAKKFSLNDDSFNDKVKSIDKQWEDLKAIYAEKEKRLDSLFSTLNLNSDLNEAESWLKDIHTLVTASDVGTDEVTSNSLLNRHQEVCQQISEIDKELSKLKDNVDALLKDSKNTEQPQRKKTVERSVPQVRALYSYSGHGIDVKKGELMFLLAKSNKDWWNVRTATGCDGFVPRNYVKEVEPKIVQVEVVQDVEHFKTGSEDLSPNTLKNRYEALVSLYNNISKKAGRRRTALDNAMKFFAFKAECDRIKFWLSERQKDLLAIKHPEENGLKIDEICKSIAKYEPNIQGLRKTGQELIPTIPSSKDQIIQALNEVEKLWANMDNLRKVYEKKITNSVQIEMFKKSVEETNDWIMEKLHYIDALDSMFKTNPLDNMIRRHKALEREMMPIAQRVDDVKLSYKTVSFTDEGKSVAPKIEKMVQLHQELTQKFDDKGSQLLAKINEKKFSKLSKEYCDWLSSRRSQLEQSSLTGKDVSKADAMKALVEEIDEEFTTKEDDYKEALEIGKKLLERDENPNVDKMLNQMKQGRTELNNLLKEQQQIVELVTDFRRFNQEADAIERHISSCHRMLPELTQRLNDEELDDMIKRQGRASTMIESYDKRVAVFLDSAKTLNPEMHIQHEDSMHRKDNIEKNWKKLNDDFGVWSQKIEDNKTLLELLTTMDDMQQFINEKEKVAQDVSYRDPSHLRNKLKKHEVLAGEVKANGSEMTLIKHNVEKLREEQHPDIDVIEDKYDTLHTAWETLWDKINWKYEVIKESLNEVDVNNGLEDINDQVAIIATELQTPVVIQDVKHCNQLEAKNKGLNNTFKGLEQKLKSLETDASEIQDNNHKRDTISNALDSCRRNIQGIKPLFEERTRHLEKSLQFHETMSQLNSELQWVGEKDKQIGSGVANNAGLMQVRSLTKRHKGLEEEVANHLPVVEELVQKATQFQDYDDNKPVVHKAAEDLVDATANLKQKLTTRAAELDLAVKIHTILEEMNEIENWIEVKRSLIESQSTGKDEDTILMYLTKQKALELELDSYAGIISEVKNNAQSLCQSEHPMADMVRHKDQSLTQELNALQKMSRARRNMLMSQLQYHEFLRECNDLRKWIREKMLSASSQDLGQDYEHLEVLITKYQVLRKEIAGGKEKLDNCLLLSQRLKNPEADVAKLINEERDACVQEWEELVEVAEVRGKKLKAAGEIHKFNRDIAEALLRIQEKGSSLGNETGKDIKSTQKLLRYQEVFENDLVALKGQLETLAEDSASLQAKYPGPNAEHIAEQLAVVRHNWENLQERSKMHKHTLQSNYELQLFFLRCQDLTSWCSHLKIMLLSEEKVSSVAEAQLLKTEHENLKSEIEAKENNFSELIQSGDEMQEKSNPFKEELDAKLASVLKERESLHLAWQQKKVYLDQLLDLHFFLRDTKQIMAFYTGQERIVNRTVNVEDMEAIEKELKFFETNNVKLKNFEEKTRVLQGHAKKLVMQNHFDSNFIQRQVEEISAYQQKVLDSTNGREIYLKYMMTSLEFQRDVSEVQHWIKHKMDSFSKAAKDYEQGSLSEKIKFLQKYTVFENEISKHEVTVEGIVNKGEILIHSNHKVEETKATLKSLLKLWEELKQMSDKIRRELQDALDMYNFEAETDAIESMVREKEYMSNVSDIGKDLEHCKDLQHKLTEENTDMNINEKIKRILKSADTIKSNQSDEAQKAMDKLESVVQKWNSIQDCINNYKKTLSQARTGHQLISDMNDVIDIVAEKKKMLVADEKSLRSPATVEKLIQKCTTILDFLRSLEGRIAKSSEESKSFIQQQYPLHEKVGETCKAMIEVWQSSLDFCETQMANIRNREAYLKSIKIIQDQQDALQIIISSLDIDPPPTTEAEIDAALAIHEDQKAAIQIQHDILKSSEEKVMECQTESEELNKKLQEDFEAVRELLSTAHQKWNDGKDKLVECKEYQVFHLKVSEINSWLENKSALMEAVDNMRGSAGVHNDAFTHADIDTALRRQLEFDRALAQQHKSYDTLKEEADELIQKDHFQTAAIQRDMLELENRLEQLKDKNAAHMEENQGSKQCSLLLRKINEMRSWIKEKLHVALDESYLDLTNVHSKLQRHIVFESEIISNSERLEQIIKEAEDCSLLSVPKTTIKEVNQQVDDIKEEWKHLNETMKAKRVRLEQANKAVDFMNSVDEVKLWMNEAEDLLQSDDLGKDVESVNALLKKHATLEADLCQQDAKLVNLKETCNEFEKDNHFAIRMLEKSVSEALQQLEKLQNASVIMKENLDDSLVYHKFVKDIHDAILWEKEKIALVSSSEFGKSLVEVQSMMKRHQLLEADIANHNNIVAMLVEKGEQLIKSNHQQSSEIDQVMKELVTRKDQLRDSSSLRKLRLDDALESQQFFIQCHELMSWINEKDLMVSQKIHIDNDFIQSLLKRIESLELELATHSKEVQDLQEQADAFVKRGHFDSNEIEKQIEIITAAFQTLEAKVTTQKDQLSINQKIYQFNRDSEELEDLITSRLVVASSEDYGKDLDDVERLMHNYETFYENLLQQKEKLNKFNELAMELESTVQDYEIGARRKEVNSAWDDLMELSSARKEALAGAKMVHAFDKKIDEMLDWILEKEALLSVEINCQDSESIQDHKQRQVGVKQEIKALGEQVVGINSDADALIQSYPDAKDHILAKRRDMLRAVEKLDAMIKSKDTQITQGEQLLEYLATFRELMSWATEFLARMSAPELSDNLQDAVTVHSRHTQLNEEMKLRDADFISFEKYGKQLIKDGHLMSDDITDKINTLVSRKKTLIDCWELRNRIYEQHMDYLKWLKDITELEGWLKQKEEDVYSTDYGKTFDELDKLMLKQLEMEEALLNKESKIDGIKRITLIETEFKALKEKEEEARRADEKRLENERMDAIKKKEAARKTRERKREDERRRTQEIVLPPSNTFQRETSVAENDQQTIPRFNTRRSLRQPKWKYDPSSMPPVLIDGFLERKQQNQSGGKRSTIRSWKTYFTVLSGPILCFFKDENDFKEAKNASPPILIHNAQIEEAKDYTKKKYVIRLITQDSSEFLFDAATRENQKNWIEKLMLSAELAPSESVKRSTVNMDQPSPTQQYLQPPEPLYENVHHHTLQKPHNTPSIPEHPHLNDGNQQYDNNHQQQYSYGQQLKPGSRNNTLDNRSVTSGDTNYSEVDGREKKHSKLSKFLGRKNKISS